MSVVAMMDCRSKTPIDADDNPGTVELQCVATGEHEEFFKYTPWGECRMGILSESALEQFEPGATYRVTFERV